MPLFITQLLPFAALESKYHAVATHVAAVVIIDFLVIGKKVLEVIAKFKLILQRAIGIYTQ